MSLDDQVTRLLSLGTVTVSATGIQIDGFDGINATCRDVAVLAMIWAIGELQRDLMSSIEMPGGGNACIGAA
jgi:hypothetical protein